MTHAIDIFTDFSDVQAHISLSHNGNMKLRDDEGDDETRNNQKIFLSKTGIDYDDFVYGHVVHGINVAVVTDTSTKQLREVDVLVTKTPGIFIGLTVADCFPVYFYDPIANVCAVAHAGWRGTVKGVIPAAIEVMVGEGARHENIHVEFGPGISQANFEFHYTEMIKEFGQYSQDKYIDAGSSLEKINIDLQAILGDQLTKAGINLTNSKNCTNCTFSDEQFFSARRHQGDSHSAMLAVIGMPTE